MNHPKSPSVPPRKGSPDEGSTGFRPPFRLESFSLDERRLCEVGPNESAQLGRGAHCELRFCTTALSRSHARFVCTEDTLCIEDLGSLNGTWVDGSRVERAQLWPGAEVRTGHVVTLVHAGPVGATRGPATQVQSLAPFLDSLASAVRELRHTGVGLTVAAMRAVHEGGAPSHVAAWASPLCRLLRAGERCAIYGPDVLLLMMRGTGLPGARARLEALHGSGVPVLAGLSELGVDAATADDLLAVSIQGLQAAHPAAPVQWRADTAEPSQCSIASPSGVYTHAIEVASGCEPLLLHGEPGSGKAWLARYIHRCGRAGAPFVALRCNPLDVGPLLSVLRGGTGAGSVHLVGVQELDAHGQSILLRALREAEVNPLTPRLIAGVEGDWDDVVRRGGFRRDLLRCLSRATVLALPPLRERTDMAELAQGFAVDAAMRWSLPPKTLSSGALRSLQKHPWPGNLRELKNVVERAVLVSDDAVALDENALPSGFREW